MDTTESSNEIVEKNNNKKRRMDDIVSLKDASMEKLEPDFKRDIMEAVMEVLDEMTYLGKIKMYHESGNNGPILRAKYRVRKHFQNIEYSKFSINDIIATANEISIKLQLNQ